MRQAFEMADSFGVEHLERALTNAGQCDGDPQSSKQLLHRDRSQAWVRCLADELRSMFTDANIRVFCKADDRNREEFGLNELLYDVCVCRTETCPSARHRKSLRYVTAALWQVESEFARDSHEAVKDFNKLVIGSADNKLFIGPRLGSSEIDGYLKTLLRVALCCTGNVYVAMVPHPGDWGTDGERVLLWQLADQRWQPLAG
jgi:hypothetical protein